MLHRYFLILYWNEVNCELRKYKWNEDVVITVESQFKHFFSS